MIHIQGVFTKNGEGRLLVSDGAAAASINHSVFRQEVGDIVSTTMEFQYTHDEFKAILEKELKLYAFREAVEAVEWAEQEIGTQKVLKELGDPEGACKEYLEDMDYAIYTDEYSAIEALNEKMALDIGGPNAIHTQYAEDAMEKVEWFVKKHGWLKLHDLLAAAI